VSRNTIRGDSAATIAASVERALQAGTLGERDRLPAIRDLAASLRVSPVTVAAAYRLLHSRGLAVGRGRQGTRLRAASVVAAPVGRMKKLDAGLVDLATGNPDPTLLPPLNDALRIVHLKGSYDLIWSRMHKRTDHYMKPQMLRSQFEALEEPTNALAVDISLSVDDILQNILELISKTPSAPSLRGGSPSRRSNLISGL